MTDRSAVVTRIAPSPTGSMHIGNARAALFNRLYARHTGGRFLLRIEDTDRERSTEASVGVIFDSLDWLGLDYDGEPVFQFARVDRHRAVVDALMARGGAYRCYMTPDEAEAAKLAARDAGQALHSPWRDRTAGPQQDGQPFVVRFKTPLPGETVIDDLVRGRVAFPNKDIEDLVLLRSDATPTYNLAVTVDDHDMGVTHVIRGEEHLSNAARQTMIYQAMDWPLPVFAHLPLILGADGAKLSKRHGAQAVGEFREMGYLPEALRNYLARLGWGHGDAEIFSDAQAIAWFDLKDVVKSPARLDWAKLNHINQHYIQIADDARLTALVTQAHTGRGVVLHDGARGRLGAAVPLVKDGAQTILQLADLTAFAVLERPIAIDPVAAKRLDPEAVARLGRLALVLERTQDWSIDPLNVALRAFAEAEGVGMGKFGPALRAALSGGVTAPDLASLLTALGREESLGRLQDALSHAA